MTEQLNQEIAKLISRKKDFDRKTKEAAEASRQHDAQARDRIRLAEDTWKNRWLPTIRGIIDKLNEQGKNSDLRVDLSYETQAGSIDALNLKLEINGIASRVEASIFPSTEGPIAMVVTGTGAGKDEKFEMNINNFDEKKLEEYIFYFLNRAMDGPDRTGRR
jgi:hypothetical protein